MTRALIGLVSVLAAAPMAFADEAAAPSAAPAAAGKPDMSKSGPWTRKPTNEKQTKKEIADFFKQGDEAEKKGDFDKSLAMVDFPVYMATDDSKGVPSTMTVDKDAYTAMMKPFWDNMPKDAKTTHKPTISVLSDSLANVVDDFTMTANGKKTAGRNQSILVKRDGQWKWKVMTEAGWGDMPPPAGANAPGAAPSSAK
jgi:hypothetical protein